MLRSLTEPCNFTKLATQTPIVMASNSKRGKIISFVLFALNPFEANLIFENTRLTQAPS